MESPPRELPPTNILQLDEVAIHAIGLRLRVSDLQNLIMAFPVWNDIFQNHHFHLMHFKSMHLEDRILFRTCEPDPREGYYGHDHLLSGSDGALSNETNTLPRMMPVSPLAATLLGPVYGIFCIVDPAAIPAALMNLATRHYNAIPGSPLHECMNPPLVGVGFDDETNDFKVLLFRLTKSRREAAVYRSSTDEWVRIDAAVAAVNATIDDTLLHSVHTMRICILRGYLNHWLMPGGSVLALDMKTSTFEEFMLPDEALVQSHSELFEYEGEIACMSFLNVEHTTVWVRNGGFWNIRFNINMSIIPEADRNIYLICLWRQAVFFMNFVGGNRVVLMKYLMARNGIMTQKRLRVNNRLSSIHIYKESLITLPRPTDPQLAIYLRR